MRPEVSGNPRDYSHSKGDDNNFIETPDGRAKGKRNIAGTPVNSNGGTTAMRGTTTASANAGMAKVGGDAIENHVGAKPLTGGKAKAPLKPGHEGMGTVSKKTKR